MNIRKQLGLLGYIMVSTAQRRVELNVLATGPKQDATCPFLAVFKRSLLGAALGRSPCCSQVVDCEFSFSLSSVCL